MVPKNEDFPNTILLQFKASSIDVDISGCSLQYDGLTHKSVRFDAVKNSCSFHFLQSAHPEDSR